MPTDYTGDPSTFSETIPLLVGGDAPSAALWRVPEQKLLDNTAYLRDRVDPLILRGALATRPCTFTTTATANIFVTPLAAVEGMPGPILLARSSEVWLVFEDGSGVLDEDPIGVTAQCAACDPSGRVLVGGATTPYVVIRSASGAWSDGSDAVGGTVRDLVYSPAYSGFLAARTSSANVYRSVDGAVAWTSAPTSLSTAVQRLAATASGHIIALGNASPTPTFARSGNHGASFSLTGTSVPHAAQAADRGDIAGCPLVSRLGLGDYVYHVGSYDSGARLRVARTADGILWEDGPAIEAPAGWSFGSGVTLQVCPTTGLMVARALAERSGGADSNATSQFAYVSTDGFSRWVGPVADGQSGAMQVAGGRVFVATSTTEVRASDGIGGTVYGL